MDKVRAFSKEPAPVSHVVIDERALNVIQDIALGLFHDERAEIVRPRILFQALHQYITNRGATPNFEVKF